MLISQSMQRQDLKGRWYNSPGEREVFHEKKAMHVAAGPCNHLHDGYAYIALLFGKTQAGSLTYEWYIREQRIPTLFLSSSLRPLQVAG